MNKRLKKRIIAALESSQFHLEDIMAQETEAPEIRKLQREWDRIGKLIEDLIEAGE